MSPKFYDEPKNRLPRASGLRDEVLSLKGRDIEYLKKPGGVGWFFKRALENPGVTVRTYFEENGYEYEWRATWNPETMELRTNRGGCPFAYSHHIGSTCSCCGQKD